MNFSSGFHFPRRCVLVASLALGMAGARTGWSAAAPAVPAPAVTKRIAASVSGTQSPFIRLWIKAIQEHPAVKNGQVTVTIFDARFDALLQNKQVNSIIAQKYDALIIVPFDSQAQVSAVQKAVGAGLPVVGSNTHVNSKLMTCYIGSDDTKAGEMEAASVVEKLDGKGNVVVFEGVIGQSAQLERRKGIQKVLQAHPGIHLLEMKKADWSRPVASKLMETWLAAHPGQINGVISECDDMALGALDVLKAQHISPRTVPVIGIDGVAPALDAVKAGEMASISQDAAAQSQGALDLALRRVLGPSYQPQSPIWKQYADKMPWNGGTEKSYDVPWTFVTLENVDSLAQKFAQK